MKLKEHCKTVENKLSQDLISDPDWENNKKIIKLIKSRIKKHYIPMNVLRTFAAIYLFQNVGHTGINIDQLNTILVEDDVVTNIDVIQSLNRLQTIKIIKFNGQLYSLVK